MRKMKKIAEKVHNAWNRYDHLDGYFFFFIIL